MTLLEIAKEHRDWLTVAPRDREVRVRNLYTGQNAILFFTGDVTGHMTGVAVEYPGPTTHMVLVDQDRFISAWEVFAAY